MRTAKRQLLRDFAALHEDASKQLTALEDNIRNTQWSNPHDLKQSYPKASLVGNQNVIFDICRNKYRVWAKVNYTAGVVLFKQIGTHREYDKWNIE